MLSKEKIIELTKCSASGLTKHYDSLIQSCEKYDINTDKRFNIFLANCLHETGGFRAFEENLNYSEKGLLSVFQRRVTPQQAKELSRNPEAIANHIYSNRYGNGENEGWKYRGRGIFQTTFRTNYDMLSKALKQDFIKYPEKLAEPPYAALSAGFFWQSHRLNKLADLGDIQQIRKVINGGLNGYEDVVKYYDLLRNGV